MDANVSVRRPGAAQLGVRSEVKNISSVRGVARAVQFEISRQVALLERGERVVNETRSYDPEGGVTVAMRDKEVVQVGDAAQGKTALVVDWFWAERIDLVQCASDFYARCSSRRLCLNTILHFSIEF